MLGRHEESKLVGDREDFFQLLFALFLLKMWKKLQKPRLTTKETAMG
jgi:hypothetical protein